MVFAFGSTGMELPCTALKKNGRKRMERQWGGKKEIAREMPRLGLSLAWRFTLSTHASLSRPELLISVNIPFRT